VCSVQCAVCSVQCAVCSVQRDGRTYEMRHLQQITPIWLHLAHRSDE
jgi:hypothetical protein